MLTQIANDALEFLVEEDVLPSFEKSEYRIPSNVAGLYRPPPLGDMMVHYAPLKGDLYRDDDGSHNVKQWKGAHRLIDAYIIQTPSQAETIILPNVLTTSSLSASDFLEQCCGTAESLSFQRQNPNDQTFNAIFVRDDSCTPRDLPEPYGKWLQHHGPTGAQWDAEKRLRLEMRLTVTSRLTDLEAMTRIATLDIQLSAFAPSVVRQFIELHLTGKLARYFVKDQDEAAFRHHEVKSLLKEAGKKIVERS